ncbi:hypothetical protein B9Z55_018082 [Caenorhabditis nigoni]|nr:hypothetical protein B9Z55_018082 [Caenorhabditis nigoni]
MGLSTYTPLGVIDLKVTPPTSAYGKMSGAFQTLAFSVIFLITICNYLTLNDIYTKYLPSTHRNLNDSPQMKELRRAALISATSDRKTILTAATGTDHKDFYAKVKMEVYCEQKERIGEHMDGGKYVCNPKKVKRDCTLVSLGLNNQIGYDKHIFEVTGKRCKILGADKGTQKPETIDAYASMNGGRIFVGKIPDELTILKMMESSGRDEVELLKIDIEGGEHTGLEPLIKDYFVCQILIEIHGTPAEHLRMLQTMAKYGFRLFNIDPNPVCVECCEYSLINELCMAQFGAIPLAITIPAKEE